MKIRCSFLVTSLVVAMALGASSRASAQGAQPAPAAAKSPALDAFHKRIDRQAEVVLPRVVAWRRDLHKHPELGNRETRTAKIIADHLRKLGYEVKTGVGKTGVVGVLRGGKPGPVVALRSDMDALPVVEETDLPFASRVRTKYNGRDVGVMHACGHDFHIAILMGTAEVLAGMRAELPGTVKLIFQPAEEGPPEGEEGGAPLMIREGVLERPKVDAVFGLHVFPNTLGSIAVRSRGIMAASDTFSITVRGRQTHGALPWSGIDPIVVAAQIVMGVQTIISRQSDLTTAPALITVGTIEGGNRFNIIPDSVRMTGTIRTFDPAMQKQIHEHMRRTAESIAAASGATAEVKIAIGNPVTYNDAALTARMTPSLERVAVGGFEPNTRAVTTAEDFSWYQKNVPGVFFFLGVAPRGADLATVAPNHSPRFNPDEAGLVIGVRVMASLAVDYLAGGR
jgi:amidohydrolase